MKFYLAPLGKTVVHFLSLWILKGIYATQNRDIFIFSPCKTKFSVFGILFFYLFWVRELKVNFHYYLLLCVPSEICQLSKKLDILFSFIASSWTDAWDNYVSEHRYLLWANQSLGISGLFSQINITIRKMNTLSVETHKMRTLHNLRASQTSFSSFIHKGVSDAHYVQARHWDLKWNEDK